jgi:hypothetical protein
VRLEKKTHTLTTGRSRRVIDSIIFCYLPMNLHTALGEPFYGHYDTELNDSQHEDIQHNDTQRNGFVCDTRHK